MSGHTECGAGSIPGERGVGMKLMFIGAAHEVTGSCYYLEAAGSRFLVDFGMEQGPDTYENQPLPVKGEQIDFVLLTHAHIDHSGNLPALYADGFRGEIFATAATADLCSIMLRDSAHIQVYEAEWRNKRAKRSGGEIYKPVYTMEDAMGAIGQLRKCPYGSMIELRPGIHVRFVDAGHLLGSASIEIWITEEGETRKIVFSGDIGNVNQPLINDPTYIDEADYVVMESTYGDRSHGEVPDYVNSLAAVMQQTFDRGGDLLIPSFAVGRTQEILYFIRQIKEMKLISGHDFVVYLDSPLAIEATSIFDEHYEDCYDEEAKELVSKGVNPIRFYGLRTAITVEDSKNIEYDERPKVIISASGMCEAGRIRHHLKDNLWRKNCTVLFVGYQAVGTTGRALVEGAEKVRLFGEDVIVNANIMVLPGISGHADNTGLMKWASAFTRKPKKVFVCHGEDLVTEIFAERLKKELGYEAVAPYSGTVYDLMTGEAAEEAMPVPVKKKKAAARKATSIFARLVASGQRLMDVIYKNEGSPNKDLAKFASQIDALSDKWNR